MQYVVGDYLKALLRPYFIEVQLMAGPPVGRRVG